MKKNYDVGQETRLVEGFINSASTLRIFFSFIIKQLSSTSSNKQNHKPTINQSIQTNQNGIHQGKFISSPSSPSSFPFPQILNHILITKSTPPQNAANYVSESVQGAGATASKEANKNVAKDSDASLGSRATAAKDAVFDKKDEKSHDIKGETYKGMF
jgi:hypothetical protein